MKKIAIILIITAVALPAFCYPSPSKAPRPGIWTLETEILQPQQISVNIPGSGHQRYWYTIMTITNDTFEDVRVFPHCELMTDTFQTILAGRNTPGIVFDQIKSRHNNTYPFLESLENFDRRVLQGQDNTRDIAIIWPDFDPKANMVKLFISGLSNEIARVEHPTRVDEDGEPVELLLRKTLELTFDIGGDPARRGETQMKFMSKDWIMR